MKAKLRYDKNGLGAAELMFIALYHPILFIFVAFFIKHDVGIMRVIRKII